MSELITATGFGLIAGAVPLVLILVVNLLFGRDDGEEEEE